MFNRVRMPSRPTITSQRSITRPLSIVLVAAGVALSGCAGSPAPSPSPTAAASFDACLVGSWTVVGQTQNSPANDENITYRDGEGEVFTIDATGAITIDTHAAQPVVFDSAGETFTATVAGTGKGTVTTGTTGGKNILYFKPSADDTRTTHSVDSTGAELGPPRPDTEFSAVYTCAPGRFTFYKTAVNYMVDGPIVELKSGVIVPPPMASPSTASPSQPATGSPSPS